LRIAVVGMGGVGGYFGGKLALHAATEVGTDVIFIARGKHLEGIQKHGLQLITQEGTFIARPTVATDTPENHGIMDLVLFCVKGYDLESSADLLRSNVSEATTVMTLLNGVDNAERLSRLLPKARVLNGCVYISAHIVKPGTVEQTGGPCLLLFGPNDGRVSEFEPIENLLRRAKIKAELKKDIRTVVWEKYVFVCPLASATSYLGRTFGEIMDDPSSRELLTGLIEEVVLLGGAMGVRFAGGIVQELLDKTSLFPLDTKSSMQLDFEKGKRTEIDVFTGYVVEKGEALGIETPIHQRVYKGLLERAIRGGRG
jgi:2-dehydropantoate 2-reductase